MMSAMLCVFVGGSFHFNCGDASGPSQVNFFGIVSPAEKAALEFAGTWFLLSPWQRTFRKGRGRCKQRGRTEPQSFYARTFPELSYATPLLRRNAATSA